MKNDSKLNLKSERYWQQMLALRKNVVDYANALMLGRNEIIAVANYSVLDESSGVEVTLYSITYQDSAITLNVFEESSYDREVYDIDLSSVSIAGIICLVQDYLE